MKKLATHKQSKATNGQIDLAKLGDKELTALFAESLRMSASNVLMAGRCLIEIEKRGGNVSGLCGKNFMKYLRLIGAGTFEAELAARYAGSWELLDTLAAMPIVEQQKIVENSKLPVLVNEKVETYDIVEMPHRFLGQVFSQVGVRNIEDQKRYLQGRRLTEQRRFSDIRKLKSRSDIKNDAIKIGNSSASKADVLLSLSDFSSPLAFVEEHNYETATVKITPEEKERLRALERESGLAEWELIRRALRTLGMI